MPGVPRQFVFAALRHHDRGGCNCTAGYHGPGGDACEAVILCRGKRMEIQGGKRERDLCESLPREAMHAIRVYLVRFQEPELLDVQCGPENIARGIVLCMSRR